MYTLTHCISLKFGLYTVSTEYDIININSIYCSLKSSVLKLKKEHFKLDTM